MTRKYWLGLGPSLLLGAGIVVSTLFAMLTIKSGWPVLAGPLVLAAAVIGADMLDSVRRGEAPGPSWAALILGGAIMTLHDPGLFKMLGPVMGVAAWVVLALRPRARRKRCSDA